MIIEKELDDYTDRVRQAYAIYYNALISYGKKYVEGKGPILGEQKEASGNLIDNLIGILRKPEDASLGYMVALGLLGTYGTYEMFYWLGKDGEYAEKRSERALHELQELTYSNSDHKTRILVQIVGQAAHFVREVEKILREYRCTSG